MKCHVCPNEIPKNHKKFCSYACFTKHSALTRRVYKICITCGKDYFVRKSFALKRKGNVRFCSLKCRVKYGHVKITCSNCGEKALVHRSRLSTDKRPIAYNYCSKKCFFAHKPVRSLGAGNSNYKNGSRTITRTMRGLVKYLNWKKDVKKRDKYTCRFCKTKFPGNELEVHHKIRLWKLIEDYPKKEIDVNDDYFYDIKNGMTLCQPCHGTTYGKETDTIE